LWKTLNGQDDDIDEYERRRIFNTINVDRLLVYSPEHRVTIFSRADIMELHGPSLHSANGTYSARNYFDAGYILGLLLQLDTVHCAAIGLATAGAYLHHEIIPDLNSLVAYIENWIKELDRHETKVSIS
jgi:hypothetical protein